MCIQDVTEMLITVVLTFSHEGHLVTSEHLGYLQSSKKHFELWQSCTCGVAILKKNTQMVTFQFSFSSWKVWEAPLNLAYTKPVYKIMTGTQGIQKRNEQCWKGKLNKRLPLSKTANHCWCNNHCIHSELLFLHTRCRLSPLLLPLQLHCGL